MIEESILSFVSELHSYADSMVATVDRRTTRRFTMRWPVLVRGLHRDVVTETEDFSTGGFAVSGRLNLGENVAAELLITPDTVLRFDARVCRVSNAGSGLRIVRAVPTTERRLAEMSALAAVIQKRD